MGAVTSGHSEHIRPLADNQTRRLDPKKKTLGASERNEPARAAWRTDLALALPGRRIVAVDEMATTIALTRLYARAPRNERAPGTIPKNHGTPTTLIAALTPTGLEAAMTLPGALNTAACDVFVERILCPCLTASDLVLFDNLSAHKAGSIRACIEATGAEVAFLPPYSPDLNPIEPAFSKVKQCLRSAAARTQETLDHAIAVAIDAVTPEDAQAYFKHCGYPLPAKS